MEVASLGHIDIARTRVIAVNANYRAFPCFEADDMSRAGFALMRPMLRSDSSGAKDALGKRRIWLVMEFIARRHLRVDLLCMRMFQHLNINKEDVLTAKPRFLNKLRTVASRLGPGNTDCVQLLGMIS